MHFKKSPKIKTIINFASHPITHNCNRCICLKAKSIRSRYNKKTSTRQKRRTFISSTIAKPRCVRSPGAQGGAKARWFSMIGARKIYNVFGKLLDSSCDCPRGHIDRASAHLLDELSMRYELPLALHNEREMRSRESLRACEGARETRAHQEPRLRLNTSSSVVVITMHRNTARVFFRKKGSGEGEKMKFRVPRGKYNRKRTFPALRCKFMPELTGFKIKNSAAWEARAPVPALKGEILGCTG